VDSATCAAEGCEWTADEWQRLRGLTGPLAPAPDPSNRFADDPAAAALGQRFYFDAAFSGPSRQLDALRRPTALSRAPAGQATGVSCATCHDLARGGADVSSVPGHVSVGAGVTDVNALPTVNAALHRTVFWNGRLDTLWGLNVLVAESDTTMNGNRLQTAHVVADRYGDDFQVAFGPVLPGDWRARIKAWPPAGKPGRMDDCQAGDASEPFGDAHDCLPAADRELAATVLVLWSKAIASYERRLVSAGSPFDRFMAEGPDSQQISPAARRGARLFVGKASCIDCHNGPLLSDGDYHNVGIPQTGAAVPTLADCAAGAPCDCVAGKSCLPWGRWNGLAWQRDPGNRAPGLLFDHSDDPDREARRARPAPPLEERLKGAWRTPSLRDVALTAPYMHDGAYATLEQVLWHYNAGGRAAAPGAVGTPSAKLKPLGLTEAEVGDLAAFLRTLTGAPLPARLLTPVPAP
jgi:cytochrome c peroxidase